MTGQSWAFKEIQNMQYESSDFEGANLRFFVAKWWEKFEGRPVGISEIYKLIMEADIQIELAKGSGGTPFDSPLARSPDRVLSTCVF